MSERKILLKIIIYTLYFKVKKKKKMMNLEKFYWRKFIGYLQIVKPKILA